MALPLDRLVYALDIVTGRLTKVPAASRADAEEVFAATRGWAFADGVTGLGIAFRTVGGIRTADLALKLYVLGKKPAGEVAQPAPPQVEVPDVAEPVPVDVEVLQPLKPHAGSVRGGSAIWNAGDYGNKGTLGCLATSPGAPGKRYALSATHVLARRNASETDEILAADDRGTPVRLGRLHKWAQFSEGGDYPNKVDAALAELDSDSADSAIESLGTPGGVGYYVDYGAELRSYGAMSGEVRRGEVLDWHFRGPVWHLIDDVERLFWFRDLILCTVLSKAGDSGAAVLDSSGKIVGLVAAGNSAVSMLCPIRAVIETLGIEIVTGAAPFAAAAAPEARSVARPRFESRAAALDLLARTVWGEARSEGEEGMRAVAAVIANRADPERPRWWGKTVKEVCTYGERYKQFSCWNDDDPNYWKLRNVTPADEMFAQALAIAADTLDGKNPDPTRGATHYYAVSMPAPPYWARGLTPCIPIGRHLFFNNVP